MSETPPIEIDRNRSMTRRTFLGGSMAAMAALFGWDHLDIQTLHTTEGYTGTLSIVTDFKIKERDGAFGIVVEFTEWQCTNGRLTETGKKETLVIPGDRCP